MDLDLVEDEEIAEADDAFTFSEFGEPLTTSGITISLVFDQQSLLFIFIDPMGFLYRDHVFG